MGPTEFAALMQRFFQTAIKVFTWTDAIVDKMVGDEVIGIYVPCLTGPDYRQRAVEAGLKLLRATGHADPAGPWLSIGVGVHSGETFMGSIGVEGGNYQFAASARRNELRRTSRRCRQRRRIGHERAGVERRVERRFRPSRAAWNSKVMRIP